MPERVYWEDFEEHARFVNMLRACYGLDPLYEGAAERESRHELETLRRFVPMTGDGHRRNGGSRT